MRQHPRELAVGLGLHALAAMVGLVAPQLLGQLVEEAGRGVDDITWVALTICSAVVVQSLLIRFATLASLTLGERVLARLREDFVGRVLALPLATVERAGSGDLITRTTRDVDVLARTVQLAVPDALVALATVVLTLGAIALTAPVLVLPCLIAVPVLWLSTRWYLKRARAEYLRANASYAQLTGGLSETVGGARTIDAFGLGGRRSARVNSDIGESFAAEARTLHLRTVYLPIADTGYMLPVVATLLFGGLLHIEGHVSLAAVTAATLYVQQVIGPVDRLLFWMDELQVGGASFARILGVGHASAEVPEAGVPEANGRPSGDQQAASHDMVLKGVRYAYREGHDVLRDLDFVMKSGERLAIVGPSGAGKSTLGRLLAGIHTPDAGTITVGGRSLPSLPQPELRRLVVLVTQEHHVFRGTLRDNLRVACPEADESALKDALRLVDAQEWSGDLGLDTEVGSGAVALTPAQAQQLALARLVLADPSIVILDEATSLLDSGAARHLERALTGVLKGRTVIAIAHRLHTAHDADRVVVMDDGRVTEVGRHEDLVRQGGAYARLWHSWHADTMTPAPPD
ncbi:ABC transporter ATP-binding protein [Streptomyces avidinii]|uniref:ABC transporter ATP-binding protein n=1 Tax=Streptomyces avidinii TaxID=1895 RepID=UPI00379CF65E